MDPRPVCCEPCREMRTCRPKRNCCLECHFSYEEELALPFLPLEYRQRLVREHAWLQANNFPPQAVAEHAAWEEEIFRKFCPESVCKIIERDHAAHGDGELVSRTSFPRRPRGMFVDAART